MSSEDRFILRISSMISNRKLIEISVVILLYAISYLTLVYPYTKYYIWGSDTGEYYWILKYLSENHCMPKEFYGWALVYHYMYGFFSTLSPLVQLGIDCLDVIKYFTPALVALSSVLMYILVRHLTKDIISSCFATLVYSIALPRVFAVSHPMPGSIGDLLLITAYFLILLSYENEKIVPLLLFLSSLPMTITHHLTHSIFIASTGILTILHRLYGKDEKFRIDLMVFTASYFSFVFYWLNVPEFEQIIIDAVGLRKSEMITLSIIGYAAFIMIVLAFPMKPLREPLRIPPRNIDILKVLAIYSITVSLVFFISVKFFVPGTNIKISKETILYVTPTLAIGFLAYPGWLILKSRRKYLEVLSWLIAIAAFAFYGIITKSTVFISYRYAQYIWTPTSILIGVGVNYSISTIAKYIKISKIKENIVKVILTVTATLIITTSLITTAYPSQDVLGGFEEGSTLETFVGIMWISVNLPKNITIAADHRISDLIFGFCGINATWDAGSVILLSEDPNETVDLMKFFETPSGYKRIDYIAFDRNTIKGVAGVQWENARPMSEKALEKFNSKYFKRVYANGYFYVYKVLWENIYSESGG
ncbi:MAG: hypothetical protein J7K58_02900 [Euryarchaeota archaeon]|nr:hypothetical protein [Euryarchaeota archaeon]